MNIDFHTLGGAESLPDPAALAARRGGRVAAGMEDGFCAEAPLAREHLDRLVSGKALCVTTGQQPGLFLGPLYTLHKAIATIAIAERYSALLREKVVPVFWVAGDDHDFQEANHLDMVTRDGAIERVVLRERAATDPSLPAYRELLGDDGLDALERMLAELPDSEFKPQVRDLFRGAWRPGATLAEAFTESLAGLLGRFGLVVFQPWMRGPRQAAAPIIGRALDRAPEIERALAAQGAALEAEGRAVPVRVGDGATLVMYEARLGRDRLVLDAAGYSARRSGETWSARELRDILARDPSGFSANVLLRPALEAALLPTLAYVAGPGELAYMPQTEPVFEILGIEPQARIRRWSTAVVEARVRRILDKLGIELGDLAGPAGQLESRLVREALPAEAEAAISSLGGAITAGFEKLESVAAAIDPTLQKPLRSARNGALQAVRDAEKKVLQHLKQQNEIVLGQVARARNELYPGGKPQERVFGVLPYLVRYGLDFVAGELDAARNWAAALVPESGRP